MQAEEVVPSPLLDFGPHFRQTTNTNETSDSKCIGHMISPMCAVETYEAARLRDDEELMAIARGQKPGPPKTFKKSKRTAITGYRVIAVRYFSDFTTPPPDVNRFNIQVGDVVIRVESNVCTYEPCTRPGTNSTYDYLLRKGEFGWFVAPSGSYRYDLTNLDDVWSRNR
ncbi:MAG: hypothetical protein COB46_08055 [Rhodospirillaceae bacterium]|nr:MAG: hypothetical protein COB46_08055 [Rhodospirillaceae bacterium]